MYERFGKRLLDALSSLCIIAVLSPVLLLLLCIGAIMMKGAPIFVQPRPGKDGRIFRLLKFRTMTCERDEQGNFLPDERRLTSYGKALRATSLDELPELFNVLKGDMSLVGPRPLMVKYLPLYDERQRHRHDVRPGITGLAQVNGRNALSWQERFEWDLAYINSISLKKDISIMLKTIGCVVGRKGISSQTSVTMEAFLGNREIDERTNTPL